MKKKDLVKRILDLEKRVATLEYETQIYTYLQPLTLYAITTPYTTSLKTVIYLILEHLGLEIKQTPARPERTELVKKEEVGE